MRCFDIFRSQGAKFAKAAVTPSDIQNAPMYSIKKDEVRMM